MSSLLDAMCKSCSNLRLSTEILPCINIYIFMRAAVAIVAVAIAHRRRRRHRHHSHTFSQQILLPLWTMWWEMEIGNSCNSLFSELCVSATVSVSLVEIVVWQKRRKKQAIFLIANKICSYMEAELFASFIGSVVLLIASTSPWILVATARSTIHSNTNYQRR